jgi:hypothetical protein
MARVPRPGSEAKLSRPWCSRTRDEVIAMPSPVPPLALLVVKNGSPRLPGLLREGPIQAYPPVLGQRRTDTSDLCATRLALSFCMTDPTHVVTQKCETSLIPMDSSSERMTSSSGRTRRRRCQLSTQDHMHVLSPNRFRTKGAASERIEIIDVKALDAWTGQGVTANYRR